MRRIIILGAGYAGLEAAKTLHKKLKKQNDVEILLIDQNDHHTLLTELHEVAGHRVGPEGVQVSVEHVLQYTKVKFVQDKIIKADLKEKKLYSEKAEYTFDYLITGVGSEPAYFGIPGIEENAFTLWSLDDAKKIRDHVVHMFQLASREEDEGKRKELLTFAVGGGGFTGIETMGELMEWTKTLCREYNIPRTEVRLIVVEALPTILPTLTEKSVRKAERFMKKRGVEILVNSPITEVTAGSFSVKDGTTIATKTLIWTGGIQTNGFVKELGVTVGKRNRIVVNEYCQTVEYPYVYAVGDNMEFVEEDSEVLPPLVETALQSGATAAANIAAEILGKDTQKLKSNLHGVMVSIGSLYGVAELKGMPRLSGFLAIVMKHLVNMHYLFGIGGLELCWDYLNHQLFHTQRKYGFFLESVISHARERSFRFWLVPLRIYIGYKWLMSGLSKIESGWWTKPMLILEAAETGGATSGATGAAKGAAEGIPLLGQYTPGWYQWIIENVVLPNKMIFQQIIVVTEILLAVAFLLGLFTFLASIVSIGLNINFFLSTGLYDWWYIWASFAMFAGGGRVLGVDHYLMPWLRNQLRHFQKNRSISLFKGWRW